MNSLKLLTGKPDVCIIGAGIIGNSISLSLARKGYKVHVFDSNPSSGYGTTSYSSGICRMYYSLMDSVKFSWESYQYWKGWEDHIKFKDVNGYAKLSECGALFLKSDNSIDFLKKSCELMKNANVPFKDLDFSETQQMVEKMSLDITKTYEPVNIDDEMFGSTEHLNKIIGSIYFPETGYVGNPQLAASNLYSASKSEGTEFHFNTKVTSINVDNEKIKGITTYNHGDIDCPIVINCGGPYSTQINNMAFITNDIENDMRITCRPLRREVAYTQLSKKDYDIDKNGMIVIDLDLGLYYRPEVGNKLLIGSTEPKCEEPVWEDNIDNVSQNSSDLWTNQMYRAALRIPNLEIPSSRHQQYIVSTYDVTEDWTPIYDKSAIKGYYMAIGTSGNQFKNAPVVGEMMSELVDRCENGYDQDNNPLNYELKKTKGNVDTSIFSRLRKVHNNDNNVFG